MARKSKSAHIPEAAAARGGQVAESATALLIADIALRGGNKLLRHTVDRVVGTSGGAAAGSSGRRKRSLVGRLIGAAAVRLAIRSVPGAIMVGGGLLAKTLYDRKRQRGRGDKPDDKSPPTT